jgi:hypothetical protein
MKSPQQALFAQRSGPEDLVEGLGESILGPSASLPRPTTLSSRRSRRPTTLSSLAPATTLSTFLNDVVSQARDQTPNSSVPQSSDLRTDKPLPSTALQIIKLWQKDAPLHYKPSEAEILALSTVTRLDRNVILVILAQFPPHSNEQNIELLSRQPTLNKSSLLSSHPSPLSSHPSPTAGATLRTTEPSETRQFDDSVTLQSMSVPRQYTPYEWKWNKPWDPSNPYFCHICHTGFKRKGDWMRHAHVHFEPVWTCRVCRKRFSRKDKLREHMRKFHNMTASDLDLEPEGLLKFSDKCGFCGSQCDSLQAWLDHVGLHFDGSFPGGPWDAQRWKYPWRDEPSLELSRPNEKGIWEATTSTGAEVLRLPQPTHRSSEKCSRCRVMKLKVNPQLNCLAGTKS